MTRSEAAKLLAFCAAYDQRTVGEADVAAWFLALQQFPLDLAQQAVVEHYRGSRQRIMPADVTENIRLIRRPIPGPVPVLPAVHGDPDRIKACREEINRLVEQAAAKFALDDADPDRTPRWRPGMDKRKLALAQVEAARRERGA